MAVMDALVINAFLTAGMDAFESMFNIHATNNDPYLLDINASHPWEISGVLGMTGYYKGVIVFRLHRNLSKKMLEFSGLQCKPEEMEEMSCELVSEFTNVISGHAVTKLKDLDLNITPPLTISGENHQIRWPKNYPVIAIPFNTRYGNFEVDVCFK